MVNINFVVKNKLIVKGLASIRILILGLFSFLDMMMVFALMGNS